LIALKQGGFLLYPIQGHLQADNIIEKEAALSLTPNISESLKTKITAESNEELVSMDSGLSPIYPNHQPFQMPASAIFTLDKFSFRQLEDYEEALIKHGIVVIKPEFGDEEHIFFKLLVKQLGIPLSHSYDDNDITWHIKARKTVRGEASIARSHTTDMFDMHTDASFENNPPR
jgi:hypothetical protein